MTHRILALAAGLLSSLLVRAAEAPLDLNSATAEQLEALPGLGPAKARAIVDDRTKNGPFGSVDELDRVKGIGPKNIDKLRPLVAVAAAAAASGRAPEAASGPKPARAAPAPDPELDALNAESPEGKVNLNLATIKDLTAIDGMTEAQAKLIVKIRKIKGPYRHLGELVSTFHSSNAKGALAKIRYFITVKLDANTATAEQLVASGVPLNEAEAFVAARKKKGKLKSVKELDQLPGLPPGAAAAIKPWLWFP